MFNISESFHKNLILPSKIFKTLSPASYLSNLWYFILAYGLISRFNF